MLLLQAIRDGTGEHRVAIILLEQRVGTYWCWLLVVSGVGHQGMWMAPS